MAAIPPRVFARLEDAARVVFPALGYSSTAAEEAVRDTLWWTFARVGAARAHRGLLAGWSITWSSTGYADLVPFEVARAGRNDVTILLEATAVSPGTERAQYLRLPNAARGLMARPGYSGAGRVLEVGRNVTGLSEGDLVAVRGSQHASVITAPRSRVYPVPSGVAADHAALVMLGAICGNGVRIAEIRRGEPFSVVGAGPIGALAQRLAVSRGAGRATFIARSHARRSFSGEGTPFLTVSEDAELIESLASPVVIEAAGDPDALLVACRAAAVGGRVVLLGSPRGTVSDFPLELIRTKRLELVGAHIETLTLHSALAGVDGFAREVGLFLEALGAGSLRVDDLVGPAIDPREASLFYRRLASGADFPAGHFDWRRLPAPERSKRGHLVRFPNVLGRGVDADSRPMRPPRRHRGLLELGDQLAGASGDLRIGLLGCGDIALQNAAAIGRAPNARLVACFDPLRSLAEEVARPHGAAIMPSVEALLEAKGVDAVFICVPHHLHAGLAIQAAQHGKHVIVEKPQANDLAAAVEMRRVAHESGVALSVCFPQRYQPAVVLARRLVAEGALGEVGGFAVELLLDKTPAYWVGGFSGRSQSDWRRSRAKAGGGILIMNLSHYIDLVRYVGGVELQRVSAVAASPDSGHEVEDSITLAATLPNGGSGSIVGSSSVRATVSSELRIWGRDGHIALEPRARVFSLRSLEGLRTGRWQTLGRLPRADVRCVYVSRLATALAHGEPPDVSADDGVATQAVIEAAYNSAERRLPVSPEDLLR